MPELNITAGSTSIHSLKPLVGADTTGADILSFYTSEEKYGGTSGYAFLDEICDGETNDRRLHIIEWRKAMATNAEVSLEDGVHAGMNSVFFQVLAHELAHNLGVRHDHQGSSHEDKYKEPGSDTVVNLGSHKSQECNVGEKEGFMTYGPGTKWSPCSAFDVLQRWRAVDPWCMETLSAEEACGPLPRKCK